MTEMKPAPAPFENYTKTIYASATQVTKENILDLAQHTNLSLAFIDGQPALVLNAKSPRHAAIYIGDWLMIDSFHNIRYSTQPPEDQGWTLRSGKNAHAPLVETYTRTETALFAQVNTDNMVSIAEIIDGVVTFKDNRPSSVMFPDDLGIVVPGDWVKLTDTSEVPNAEKAYTPSKVDWEFVEFTKI